MLFKLPKILKKQHTKIANLAMAIYRLLGIRHNLTAFYRFYRHLFFSYIRIMIDPAAGILLIAEPFLKDPNFLRSVVFLCEHNEEGSFGFVLNRQYENTIDELIPELEGHRIPVFYGGPVQVDTIHFLHQYPTEIPGGQEVMKGVYWGGDFDAVVDMIKNKKVKENKIRFYIGYSGWEKGQLTEEMKEKTWLTVKAASTLVFHKDYNEIWKDSIKHLGGDYEIMINFPLDPQLN
jgi:putative transcriptional regulator